MVSYVWGRVYLTSTSLTGMGVFTPLYFLVGLEESLKRFQIFMLRYFDKKDNAKNTVDSLS